MWEVKLKASVTATPATYLGSDKRQYVAMSDTGGSQTGSVVTNDEIIAFALPKKCLANVSLTIATLGAVLESRAEKSRPATIWIAMVSKNPGPT